MTVCLKMGSTYENIGSGTYTKAIFSTICVRLEHGAWGSRFPVIMNQLYHDVVPVSLLSSAVQELDTIIREFSGLKPSDVVWDLYERDAVPTWGRDIRDDITSVLDYFVTDIGASALRAMLRLFIHAVCGNESVTLDDTRFLGDSVPPIVVGKGKGAADDSIRLRSGVVGRTLINNHMIAALPSLALSSGFKVFQNILWKQCGAFDVIIALRCVGLNGNRIEARGYVVPTVVDKILDDIVAEFGYLDAFLNVHMLHRTYVYAPWCAADCAIVHEYDEIPCLMDSLVGNTLSEIHVILNRMHALRDCLELAQHNKYEKEGEFDRDVMRVCLDIAAGNVSSAIKLLEKKIERNSYVSFHYYGENIYSLLLQYANRMIESNGDV